MKRILLSALAALLVLTGCAYTNAPDQSTPLKDLREKVFAPIEQKLTSDFVEAQAIGTIVNKPEVVQCSAYLQGVVDSLKNGDAVLAKLEAEDTRGLAISSILKDYFASSLKMQSTQQAIADFEQNFPLQCGKVQSVVSMEIFKKAVFGASLGKVR